MSTELRAVPDVNVLVSAVRSPGGQCGRLLEDATGGRWRPVVSLRLIEELEEVLARPKFKDVLGQETIDRFLADLLSISEWAEDPEAASAPATRDPDDEYLLALDSLSERRCAGLRGPRPDRPPGR